MSDTLLAERLATKGLRADLVRLDREIALFLNGGGTIREVFQRAELARDKLHRNGHHWSAENGHSSTAAPMQLHAEDGQPPGVNNDHGRAAASIPQRVASHYQTDTSGVQKRSAGGASPSIARIAAERRATRAALTILDTIMIDGRAIGSYTVAEALRIGKQKTKEGYILLRLARTVANADPFANLRDVVKIEEVQLALQSAEEMADAA